MPARGWIILAVLASCLVALVPPAAHADSVDDYIKTEMERRRIPGAAVAVAREGKLVKVRGYGLANVELDVPVTPVSVFELASVTKQFTATALLVLVEHCTLQLKDAMTEQLQT